MTMNHCDALESLLSGYLDGELTQEDRQRVELHIESCSRCRHAYEKMSELRDGIGKLSFDEMSTEEWDRMMNDVGVRASRGFGWLFYIAGLIVLMGYAAFEFMRDDTVDAIVKTSVAAIVLGLLLLLMSVLRQRLIAAKSDKYRDVQI
jgi:anti-sigma factor RsiW